MAAKERWPLVECLCAVAFFAALIIHFIPSYILSLDGINTSAVGDHQNGQVVIPGDDIKIVAQHIDALSGAYALDDIRVTFPQSTYNPEDVLVNLQKTRSSYQEEYKVLYTPPAQARSTPVEFDITVPRTAPGTALGFDWSAHIVYPRAPHDWASYDIFGSKTIRVGTRGQIIFSEIVRWSLYGVVGFFALLIGAMRVWASIAG